MKFADGSFAYEVVRLGEHNSLDRAYVAVRFDGALLPLGAAERYFAEAHRARFGALQVSSAMTHFETGPGTVFRALIWLEAGVEAAAVIDSGWATEAAYDPVTHTVAAFVEHERVFELARAPFVRSIGLDYVGLPVHRFGVPPPGSIPSPAITSNSDTAYNADSITGAGVRVGITEAHAYPNTFPVMGLDEMATLYPHEAFGAGSIRHQYPDATCTTSMDCSGFAVSGTDRAECLNGVCQNEHLLGVASRIASRQGSTNCSPPCVQGDWHAAGADLYVAGFQPTGGQPLELAAAYKWLAGDDPNAQPPFSPMDVVNESWGPLATGLQQRDQLTDWYARHRRITFVQAAGNSLNSGGGPRPIPPNGFEDESDQEVACAGVNTICVGGVEFNGGARKIDGTELSVISRWGNPTRGGVAVEIEKPDVVAETAAFNSSASLGHTAHLPPESDPNVDDEWDPDFLIGTSFAAPVVSGLLALSEECASKMESSPIRFGIGLPCEHRPGTQ